MSKRKYVERMMRKAKQSFLYFSDPMDKLKRRLKRNGNVA